MKRAKIVGVGAYAPQRVLTNAELEKMVDTSDEWIVQRTGIRERHIVDDDEATSDLALRAAQQALERAGVAPEEIDLIVVGTTAGDMLFPTTANILQHRLGCRNAGSIDVYAACAGSVYSLSVGAQYIQTGKYGTVLCVGAECLSRITDYTDRGHVHPARRRRGRRGAAPVRRRARDHRHRPLLRRHATGSSLCCPAAARAIPPPTRRSTAACTSPR